MTTRAESLRDWGLKSQFQANIKASVEVARTESELIARDAVFNREADFFPAANGLINLRTGELMPHDPTHFHTWCSPLAYRPGQPCERWRGFLREVYCDDEALIAYLQRMIGYCLTGRTEEHSVFIWVGRGRNGKSTMLKPLLHLLGKAGKVASIQSFLTDKHGNAGPRPDILTLQDARLVATSEVNRDRTLDSAAVKGLSGGDKWAGRTLYSPHVIEFEPTFKLLFLVNDLPVIQEADEALFARLHVVPFNRVFSDAERDPQLADRLLAESEGILAWAVEGAQQWYRSGLCPPATVLATREAYRRDMSPVAAFIAESCIQGSRFETPAADLFLAFSQWAAAEGIPSISQTQFGRTLSRIGFSNFKRGVKHWRGLRLQSRSEGL